MSSADKNPNRVAGGLKATINNPNTSEETKQEARERLDNFDSEEVGTASTRTRGSAGGIEDDVDETLDDATYNDDGGPADVGTEGSGYSQRQLGGFKAALHRDGTSEEAKEKARDALASAGQSEEPLN